MDRPGPKTHMVNTSEKQQKQAIKIWQFQLVF